MSRWQAENPATGETLPGSFSDATPADVDRAMAGAGAAHVAPDRPDAAARAALLERIAAELEERREPLLHRAHAETALPSARLETELGRTTAQLRMFAALLRSGAFRDAASVPADPERRPLPRPDLRRESLPLGPVVVFGASNFPLAFGVAGGDTASALAAGCPVVVKAHPFHPGTCDIAADAVRAAVAASGMADGTFAMLHGASHDVGRALVRHPAARAVAFTGSLRGGRALFDAAASRPLPIPVHAEMGSVNPVFLLPEALSARRDAIAQGLVASFTLGVGQFCTNPGLVVHVAGSDAERFAVRVAEGTAAVAPGVMLHRTLRDAYVAAVDRASATPGVSTLSRVAAAPGAGGCGAGAAVLATDARTFRDHPHLADEIFGPSTLLVSCGDRGEMLDLARTLPGQLTATVHAEEGELDAWPDLLHALAEAAGRVVCNGFPTGVEVNEAMHHGGPYPASTDARHTSVGTAAIRRFQRPICWQGFARTAG